MQFLEQLERHWIATSAGTAAAVAAVTAAVVVSRRPTAEERERKRRQRLAKDGRIVDGSLVDVEPSDAAPAVVMYRYRIAGVTYECSQDVRALPDSVRGLRLDLPVQVRYNRANPYDSIVVAEAWNGLRSLTRTQIQ